MAYGDVYHKVANDQGSVDVAVDLGGGRIYKIYTDTDGSATSLETAKTALLGMTLIHEAPKK